MPGTCFGRHPTELTLRLSFVDFDGASTLVELEKGASLDRTFVERHAARMIEGLSRLERWMGS